MKDKRGDAFAHGVFVCWGEGNMVIAKVSFGEAMYRPEGKPEANARLIAAAPELLKELKHQVEYMARINPNGEDSKAVKFARSAIAKAEGKRL